MVWSSCILFKALCTHWQMQRTMVNWIFLWSSIALLEAYNTSLKIHPGGLFIGIWNHKMFCWIVNSNPKSLTLGLARFLLATNPNIWCKFEQEPDKFLTISDPIIPISDFLVTFVVDITTWVTWLLNMPLTGFTPQKWMCTALVFFLWKLSWANQTTAALSFFWWVNSVELLIN